MRHELLNGCPASGKHGIKLKTSEVENSCNTALLETLLQASLLPHNYKYKSIRLLQTLLIVFSINRSLDASNRGK